MTSPDEPNDGATVLVDPGARRAVITWAPGVPVFNPWMTTIEALLSHPGFKPDFAVISDWRGATGGPDQAFVDAFLVFCHLSVWAWLVLTSTHAVIDHWRLAKYVVFAKNFLAPRSAWPKWEDCKDTGYDKNMPPFMSVWLLIIADNVLHLVINYSALRWL